MRLVIIIMLSSLIYLVSAKSHVKQLTESLGQEVIEIGAPIKELPMGLEEEPSAEEDTDDSEKVSLKTANTASPATKKDVKKTTTILKKDVKKLEKIEALNLEEDEARIEKELSEIYKDTADYKSDSAEEKEVAKETETPTTTFKKETEEDFSDEESDTERLVGRQRPNFKFQPDATDPASIERFRTSVDQVSCQSKQVLKASVTPETIKDAEKNAFRVISNGILLITAILSYVFICC